MQAIQPLSSDAASIPVGDLTIENGNDRIAIYGSLNITRDQAGLQLAQASTRLCERARQCNPR
jgi:hypothetical protein